MYTYDDAHIIIYQYFSFRSPQWCNARSLCPRVFSVLFVRAPLRHQSEYKVFLLTLHSWIVRVDRADDVAGTDPRVLSSRPRRMMMIMLMMLMRWRNAKPCVLSGVRSRPWTRTFPLNPSMEEGRIQTVSMSRLFISPVVFPCLDTKCFGVTCYCMLIRWPCLCEALCDVANQSTYTNIHCRATCTHTWRTKTKALVFSSLFDV
ncbi:unnamed protein product [Ixodes persulcatus]